MRKKKENKAIIKKSNTLIRSKWAVSSIWEPRLVALVASKIQVDDEDFKEYEVPVMELVKAVGQRKSGKTYIEICSALRKIMQSFIEIYDHERREMTCLAIFACCTVSEITGVIKVSFHPKMKPFYLNLKSNFTLYNFEEFTKLPSTYSMRIFEILSSWKNLSEVTIPLKDLHEALNVPQSFKKDFREFRRSVLEQSCRDILEHTSLYFEWAPVKEGQRKVVAIHFILDRKKAEDLRRARELEEQKQQSKRNNKIVLAAYQCYFKSQGTKPPADETACDYCQQINLPFLDCQRVQRLGGANI